MDKYSEIKKEIRELIVQGTELYNAVSAKENEDKGKEKGFYHFLMNYDRWYTKALAVIKQITPERLEDFILLYRNEKRKEIDVSTYTISDALRTISVGDRVKPRTARMCVMQQINMVYACLERFDSRVSDMQTVLQADIFDSEIESAKHLKSRGFLRAAGAICGVVLEKHFSIVSENRGIQIKRKSPTIADYNDAFKDQVYDILEWRRIQRLGDIRNLCDHHKDREPTVDEVNELISGVERIIKTVF